MSYYRLYFMRDGHIIDREAFDADDDGMAHIIATLASEECSERHDGIDLWSGARRVPSEASQLVSPPPDDVEPLAIENTTHIVPHASRKLGWRFFWSIGKRAVGVA